MISPTITAGQVSLSFNELKINAAKFATGLQSLGVQQGDSVAIMLRNDLPYLEVMLGTTLLGVYAASINWHLKGSEVSYILDDCKARVLVVHEDLLGQIIEYLPENITVLSVNVSEDIKSVYNIKTAAVTKTERIHDWKVWRDQFEPYTESAPVGIRNSMIYTSGTTGSPKGIRRNVSDESSIKELQKIMAQAYGIRPSVRAVMTGPLYHSATFAYATLVLSMYGDLVLQPRFDEEKLLQTIQEKRITHMHMVPTMFVRLLQLPEEVRHRYDLSSLEYVVHGAAPCPVEVKRKMIEWWGPVINEYYGSSEAGLMTCIDSADWLTHQGSVGKSLVDTDLKIFDDNGGQLPANKVGEIFVRINKARDFTYHEKPQLREEIAKGNYITNGDIGYLDEEGFLYICDRKKDMIISGGVNIFPVEIEEVLLSHPAVKDCAVFGIPDNEYGESIAAALEVSTDVSETEIKEHIKSKLAS